MRKYMTLPEYYADAGRIPRMSNEEIVERIREVISLRSERDRLLYLGREVAARRKEAEAQKIRATIVAANLRLVIHLALLFQHRVDLDELVSEGNLGLFRAVDKFDPSMGTKFSTYATHWIKQFMFRLCHQVPWTGGQMHIPEYVFKLLKNYTRDGLPTKDLEREHSGIQKTVKMALRAQLHVISSVKVEKSTGPSQESLLEVIPCREEEPFNSDDHVKLKKMLAELTEKERLAVVGYFCNGETLVDIGIKFGVTRERARQIKNSGLKKLKEIAWEEDWSG